MTSTKNIRPIKRTSKTGVASRGLLLLVCSLSLGLLSACSNVRTEIVENKQATSQDVTRSLGATKKGGSLWSIDYQVSNERRSGNSVN